MRSMSSLHRLEGQRSNSACENTVDDPLLASSQLHAGRDGALSSSIVEPEMPGCIMASPRPIVVESKLTGTGQQCQPQVASYLLEGPKCHSSTSHTCMQHEATLFRNTNDTRVLMRHAQQGFHRNLPAVHLAASLCNQ